MSDFLAVALLILCLAIGVAAAFDRIGLVVTAVGSALLSVTGFVCAGGWSNARVDLGTWLGFGSSALVSDRLAGIFLALVGATAVVVSLSLAARPRGRLTSILHPLVVLAVAAVIGANQGFVFLLAWETITLCLYLLGSAERERPDALFAGYFGSAFSKIGGGALLAAFALLYGETGSFKFSDWTLAAPHLGDARSVAFVLLLVGFGSKIGLLPFQGALPPLYAAAPGATSATIAVAFNAGFYGLWRLVFGTLGPAPMWWGEMLIVLGGLGALVGILYAVIQRETKRFLGFSSVEHGGIALIGFGVALVGQGADEPRLAAAGLLAATLHVIMHGLAKTVAFLGADRVTDATGTDDELPLGGLAQRLPVTALGFGLAVLTLAAMPPFGGFVSEWFTLEALLQGFRLDDTVAQLIMALGGAMLALTAGLGLLAFAKLYGGIFLGRARSALGSVRESRSLGTGFVLLSAGLLFLGAAAPWEIRWLGRGLSGLLGFNLAKTTISDPLVLGPVYPNFSVLAPTWLALAILTFLIAAALLVRLLLRPTVRRAPVWLSGSAPPIAAVQYTPEGYANPIRVVLAGVYGFRRTLERQGGGREPIRLVLETRVVPAFEHYLYQPLTAAGLWLSGQARRLQSGRLSFYLLYVLLVLLGVLAMIPALRD
jgi:formate hydrogenlyase subunit 3/multisubunit Na+/H+ antiporter MnhD subunit